VVLLIRGRSPSGSPSGNTGGAIVDMLDGVNAPGDMLPSPSAMELEGAGLAKPREGGVGTRGPPSVGGGRRAGGDGGAGPPGRGGGRREGGVGTCWSTSFMVLGGVCAGGV
jgi:hypothetical protein